MTRPFAAACCLLLFAAAASAQSALGGGRALDGGLSNAPGGRVNLNQQDLQSLNRSGSPVAGNALNGPAFTTRPGGLNARPFPGSLADAVSRGLVRDPGLNRGFASPLGPSGFSDPVALMESGRLPGGALTSSVLLRQGSAPTDYRRTSGAYVGFSTTESGETLIARGTSLRGLTTEPISRVDLSVINTPGVPRTGTVATYGRVMDELRRATLARALENPARVDSSVSAVPGNQRRPGLADPTAASGSPASPAAAGATTPAATPRPVQFDPDAMLARLRQRLARNAATPAPAEPDATRPQERDLIPGTTPTGASATVTDADIDALRAMGIRLETLVPAGATDAQATDAYVRLGQEAMRAGRFGLADTMFASALTRSPTNVLARAGRVHSTMALGLMMSGGADLRNFLSEHPEMIPVRYDTGLIMPVGRAEQLIPLLDAEIDRPGGPLLPDAGLTLAYFGRQFDRPEWLERGLASMRRQGTTDPQTAELADLLPKVWGRSSSAEPQSDPGK